MTAIPGQHRAPSGPRHHARAAVVVGLVATTMLGLGPAVPGLDTPPASGKALFIETVTIHGSAGGFGSLEETVPSGQQLVQSPVPGWELPPGFQAGDTAVAADGTVFVAGEGEQPVIGAYQPVGPSFRTIRPTGEPEQSITNLTAVAGGEAVVFTAGSVLGILTKVAGEWRAATVDMAAAPAELGELVSLPGSGHLIAVQPGGALLALRLVGPDRDGRFTAEVTGRYQYPEVRDPVNGERLDIGPRHLRADPTGVPGDERFAVVLQDRGDRDGDRPFVIQEFRYDAGPGAITPVSAPTIPGDQRDGGGSYYGYSAVVYDRTGNLWAARNYQLAGGKLAVYVDAPDRPALAGPDCPFDPAAPPGSYRTGEGSTAVWGQSCRPDYDILQAQHVGPMAQLVRDPARDEVVGLTLGGTVMPVRAARGAEGSGLTFHVGNLVDTGPSLLPAEVNFAPAEGAVDARGHLWLPVSATPQERGQWLYEVDIATLFAPAPVPLSRVPGRVSTIQAGHTTTTGTEQLEGSWATVDVNSRAYLLTCANLQAHVGCNHDGVPGYGFTLGERNGYGHLDGEVGYRVDVPEAGRYRVTYRVSTFEAVEGAEITLSIGGETHRTPVDTNGQWRSVPGPDLAELPAGVHTVSLSANGGRGGWHLSWFSLQRS